MSAAVKDIIKTSIYIFIFYQEKALFMWVCWVKILFDIYHDLVQFDRPLEGKQIDDMTVDDGMKEILNSTSHGKMVNGEAGGFLFFIQP